ncbi:unnamed protein product [Discosporangium mesarthrocarpum]
MVHTSNVLLLPLNQKIDETFGAQKAENLKNFARRYFASSANADLAKASEQQLFDLVTTAWDFIQERPRSGVKIQFSDWHRDEEQNSRPGTSIYVLLNDMPFVVDSVRQCLVRVGASVKLLNNAVIHVARGSEKQNRGKLQSLVSEDDAQHKAEALTCIHCSLISKDQHAGIEAEIRDTLKQVAAAVKAYAPMCRKVEEIRARLVAAGDRLPVDGEELGESVAFIDWVLGNHFTFLGYEEYRIRNRSQGQLLEFQQDSVLGVSRYNTDIKKQAKLDTLPRGTADLILDKQVCSFAKSLQRSKVHRPAYYDYILIKEFDDNGEVHTEHRFKGLYTSSVYYRAALDIPLVRKKVRAVLDRSGFAPNGHSIKDLMQVINVFPRDELFQMSTDQLFATALGITQIQQTRTSKLFVRRDSYGKFFSCLVYVPRDIFSTKVRLKIQDFLKERLRATELDYNIYLSESVLARLHLVLRVPDIQQVKYDPGELESSLVDLVKPWEDYFLEALEDAYSEEEARRRYDAYANCFPSAYKEAYSGVQAVSHSQHLVDVVKQRRLILDLGPCRSESGAELSFKIFSYGKQLTLSEVDPILENLGLFIISEKTFKLHPDAGHGSQSENNEGGEGSDKVWLHDFSLYRKKRQGKFNLDVTDKFEDAFRAVWDGKIDDDGFNALVLSAELEWRDVALLRAYAAYLKQIQFGYTSQFVADTLAVHSTLSCQLVNYFHTLFDPARKRRSRTEKQQATRLRNSILAGIDEVVNLSEDSVLRAYLELIDATLRCNFFQRDDGGELKSYFAFKFDPRKVDAMPLPKPQYEIFVYSRLVEGVHLRGGKVARGGLRWSDRSEDYRTEVLGLVKAQQVKNSVIVPVGAKGGFIVKEQVPGEDREQKQATGVACYRTFISGLLDLTDNMVEGEVVHPEDVVRRDEDDTYLVVAADKGTATFSDIANGIAADYNFWLGDGFASGGSNGYDHKAMGITARGAWVSVQRHFREQGINVQEQDFTVLGIGDMAGDVFGNGMLLSRHICLVAAFNHRHIFIDPNPDAAASFRERQRLFKKKGSAWSDYDSSLISAGGGIIDRSAKSVVISAEMKARFGIDKDKLPPNQLITALLQSPVDLIWNGGIGTYVKSSEESHGEVGDKANDALRVNADELRCKVIGEGGNLGLTQLARIEFGRCGGISLTDFIDNSGGVDCSDHEVNIKILLNQQQLEGKLTTKRRNSLLESMTDEVADLVLDNNYSQVQAIGVARTEVAERHKEYSDLIQYLENNAGLNRSLEYLPGEDELEERAARKQYLTRPELAVLTSYMKLHLKASLTTVDYIDDPFLEPFLFNAFPAKLRRGFSDAVLRHPLRKEIIASQLANSLVNLLGPSFVYRMVDSTGATLSDVVRAALIVVNIFNIERYWAEVEALDYQVNSELQNEMMSRLIRLVRRSTRWLLRNRRSKIDFATELEFFSEGIRRYKLMLPGKLPPDYNSIFEEKLQHMVDNGVPESLARSVCKCDFLFPATSFVEISENTGEQLNNIVDIYFAIGEKLRLNWLGKIINQLPVANYWQALARETYLDDLAWQQRALTCNVVSMQERSGSARNQVEEWARAQAAQMVRIDKMLSQLQTESQPDYAMFSVALRELLNLAQTTAYKRDML